MAAEQGATYSQRSPTTGRYLVLLREGAVESAAAELHDVAGVRVATTAGTKTGALTDKQREGSGGVIFDKLGVAVIDVAPDQAQALGRGARGESAVLAVEPERIVYALGVWPPARPAAPQPGGSLSAEYLRGYHDAVVSLATAAGRPQGALAAASAGVPAVDESKVTWGLQAVGAPSSIHTGRGVRLAVLDTGFDFEHPDFGGRTVEGRSFVAGEEAQDGHGHGTHCIGTSCGPRVPADLPRYGVAFDAEIYAGKVLSNRGSGADEGILAGIEWAVSNGCRIVSMSLGAPVALGEPHSPIFESAARRALAQGTAIIAAAGNESEREVGVVAPVGHPANCPSISAVAALDSALRVASFSNGGSAPQGGQVDFAAPGVAVHSSWPIPARYRILSGTSMATPHAAGIAALLAEANPDAPATELVGLLSQTARRLPLPSTDVGTGLVQAP
jgi:subtilisin family serine protease